MKKYLLLILVSCNLFAVDFTILEESTSDRVIKNLPSWNADLHQRASNLIPVIEYASKKIGVAPELAISIAWTESHFNPSAKSYVGAKGVMQVMPKTAQYLKEKHQEDETFLHIMSHFIFQGYDSQTVENIVLGIFYINELNERFDGNITHTVVAYNMGPTWVSRRVRNNQEVGTKNHYLNKVNKKMAFFSK